MKFWVFGSPDLVLVFIWRIEPVSRRVLSLSLFLFVFRYVSPSASVSVGLPLNKYINKQTNLIKIALR